MKNVTKLMLLPLLLALVIPLAAQGNVLGPKIVIQPQEIELNVGDSLELKVVYHDTNNVPIDTMASWLITPDSLGTINTNSVFFAEKVGNGWIHATLDTLVDSVEVEVKTDEEDDYPEDQELPELVIKHEQEEVVAGDSLQLEVFYIDTNEVSHDTTATWTVIPDSLASISQTGMLYALDIGEVMVTATLDTLESWTLIKIISEEDEEEDYQYQNRVVLWPQDTVVTVGSQIQYQVFWKDSAGGYQDTVADSWYMQGMEIGTITSAGLFTADTTGFAILHAQVGAYDGNAMIIVQEAVTDSTTLNQITITRDTPNPQGYNVMQVLKEGELWKIGGLPHPMNVLNGGGVYFPVGSLSDDIRIHISLPGFAHVTGEGVSYNHEGVIAGIEFKVILADTVQEPYYFDTPLYVGLIYKRGLLNNLGIDPNTLGLYFAEMVDDSVVFDTTGIGNIIVDENFNRIYSSVAHFSALAVKGETGTVATDNPEKAPVATAYQLKQNYPNPFNPVTTIRFNIPTSEHVTLTVYNILGQSVTTLMDQYKQAGQYRIQWNASDLPSGIYLIRMETGQFSAVRRSVLLK